MAIHQDDPLKPVIRTAQEDHRAIQQALQWISPTLHQTIQAVDNFARAWGDRSMVEADLKKRLGII
jgi:hypothetical protein